MINHVVLFKLKEYDSEEKKAGVLSEIKEALLGLKEKIAELKYIEVGTNYQLAAKSFDICLITHFESIADLETYAVHPDHLKVVEIVRRHAIDRAVVDFEF
ncbi:MAG TPA: stress responsive protein [Prolixibacteraceae bacterium]|nr:MAG: hypothetical protein A2W92_10940 [Bacteroidetes bacterium GWA2_42_15]HBL78427.1 stress responsive protein [Prolixibacteraceae bacterium]HCR89328.1 stress responsive protein [Prolixibacteraceae bacterium]HCU61351.1 stress responsive protein [Prolixibacteraceae bacterium]